MKVDNSPPLIIASHFHNIDDLIETACRWNWNSDYRPLRAGAFSGIAHLARFGSIQITYETWSQAMNLQGESPKDCLSFVIVDYGDRNMWLGHPLPKNAIIIAQASQEIELVAQNPLAIWSVSVAIETLQVVAQYYGYLVPEILLQGKTPFIYPSQIALAALRRYLHNLFFLIQNIPDIGTNADMQMIVQQEFLVVLIEALILAETPPVFTPFPQYRLFKQIEAMVLANAQKPITLQDLSHLVYASDRTLNYVFHKCVGMSPMAYLKAQRLNGVRRKLKAADPRNMTVTAVANQWGFCHMGHFSQDYKNMFGDSPSTTLRMCS